MRVESPFRFTAFALTFAASLFASPPIAAQAVKKPMAAEGGKNLSPELRRVREALDKYKDPVVAVHDGYWSTVGCVTYPKGGGSGEVPYKPGGMGVHFVNFSLVGKPVDPVKPQILVYEPVAGGKLQLVAAEWLVPLSPDLKDRPQLFGQPFDGPMEGHHPLMPTALHHYDLHVWLWKENPAGMFAPTNPKVKCPPKAAYTIEESSPRIVPHTHK